MNSPLRQFYLNLTQVSRKEDYDFDVVDNWGHKFYRAEYNHKFEFKSDCDKSEDEYTFLDSIIDLAKMVKKCNHDITINENCSKTRKFPRLFFDIDFNKSSDKTKKFQRSIITGVTEYVITLIGAHPYVILENSQSDNIHIVYGVNMSYNEIKAIHTLVQKHISNKKNINLSDVLDDSVGIRLPFCFKQVETKNNGKLIVESFDENYYKSPFTRNTKANIRETTRYQLSDIFEESSIYRFIKSIDLSNNEVIQKEILWNNRFGLEESDIKKVIALKKMEDTPETRDTLANKGWITGKLIDLQDVDEKTYGFEIFGKKIYPTIELYIKLISILDPSCVDTKKGWFHLLYIIRGFRKIWNSPEVYKQFDAFCKKAENYNKENNREIYKATTKCNPKFISLVKMCVRSSLMKTLDAIEMTYFEYNLYIKDTIKNVRLPKNAIVYKYIGNTINFIDADNHCEFIQAGMGCGKTTMLGKYIVNHPGKSILLVTPKRTQATMFKEKFGEYDFVDYRDIKEHIIINESRVIIQLESLGRLRRHFDIVVFDEAHEIVNQINSQFHSSMPELRNKLSNIMKSDVVKFMDANITKLTLKFIKEMLPTDKSLTFSINETKRRQDYRYIFTTENQLKYRFIEAISNKKKCFVAANSTEFLEILNKMCVERKIASKLVYSKTDKDEKEEVVQNGVSDYQVFLYSPSITVGIDFQEEYDVGFCLFNNTSNDCYSCSQMTNRFRNVKDKTIYFNIKINHSKLDTKKKGIIRSCETRYNSVSYGDSIKNILNSCQYIEDFDTFDRVFDKDYFWFKILIAIKINNNMSSNLFMAMLFKILEATGGVLLEEYETVHKCDEFKRGKILLRKDKLEEFQAVEIIPDEKYYSIKCFDNDDIRTKEEKNEIDKYELIEVYGDGILNADADSLVKCKKPESIYKVINIRNYGLEEDYKKVNETVMTKFMMNDVKGDKIAQRIIGRELLTLLYGDINLKDCIKPDGVHLPDINKDEFLIKLESKKNDIIKIYDIMGIRGSFKPKWETKSIIGLLNRILFKMYGLNFVTLNSFAMYPNNQKNRNTYRLKVQDDTALYAIY